MEVIQVENLWRKMIISYRRVELRLNLYHVMYQLLQKITRSRRESKALELRTVNERFLEKLLFTVCAWGLSAPRLKCLQEYFSAGQQWSAMLAQG